jgi:hypothetical protein
MSELPERINVMKVVTYDVAKIIEDIGEAKYEGDKPVSELTVEDLLEWISPWVENDFSCGHGHEAHTRDLIFHDENGEDLDW